MSRTRITKDGLGTIASNATFSGTLGVTGDLAVNITKFTVAANTGNVGVSGSLTAGITGLTRTTDGNVLDVVNTNSTFTAEAFTVHVNRAATSAYAFLNFYANNVSKFLVYGNGDLSAGNIYGTSINGTTGAFSDTITASKDGYGIIIANPTNNSSCRLLMRAKTAGGTPYDIEFDWRHDLGGAGTTSGIFIQGSGAQGVIPSIIIANAGIGVGTQSPTALLHLGQSSSGKKRMLQIGEPAFTDTYGFNIYTDSGTGLLSFYGLNNSVETTTPILAMYRYSKRVGLNVAVPECTFHIVTTGSDYGVIVRTNDNGTNNFYLTYDGVGYLRASAWTYGSDRRMKKHIKYLDRDYGLAQILALQPVSFDYINGPKQQLGFIAQDVESIIPQAVSVQPDGMLGLKSEFVTPLLVMAVQNHESRIAELEKRLA